jgi:hypothetical protein
VAGPEELRRQLELVEGEIEALLQERYRIEDMRREVRGRSRWYAALVAHLMLRDLEWRMHGLVVRRSVLRNCYARAVSGESDRSARGRN